MKYSGIRKAIISDGITGVEITKIDPAGTAYSEEIKGEKDFDGKLLSSFREKKLQISSYDFSAYETLYDWMTSRRVVPFVTLYGFDGTLTWNNSTKILVRKNFKGRKATMQVLMKIKEEI